MFYQGKNGSKQAFSLVFKINLAAAAAVGSTFCEAASFQNTKIIFTGDIFQIDTPYLDSEYNGLSYLIDKVKHNSLYAHITLEKGERSDLANLANQLL